ncbi:MAG TPA: peptidylprolyl isomerase [Chloroflexus aurantiacus]|jgi:peptidyl-prolyl cis-trans isomerase C|uniref:PpiC-type peptidyl-prolyl cis-trans isomerase n=1 Tax=Chloroflexus aurantiacus (strain ATCC 29366 / DSM 635 / J-10-fl) TaxID=324602 RepID=A9WGU5_CHLAA|nr:MULTISPECIES: peptidylprolyl isomerase [Chloroflexus]ABY36261.1 PpiC-type peptidyl-prolyl cis-trans isomerase [Chloroflexus aurantiacus J-10-fl]RMG47027.1 MAG: peptidylprolyl isomerase [Chloroflexota bacterium]GIV94847.1 MAG: peptidylprolyl isomerase [Chloroflexus sp.]HBW67547.1 peptidylprolyl isomerase [Chloroflexus aurantiacus]
MRRLLWLFALLVLAGCQSAVQGQQWETVDSPVAFRLGTQVFTVADVNAEIKRAIGDGVANALASGQTREQVEQIVVENDLRRQIFEQMIQNELLLQYARQHGIGIDPAALDAEIAARLPADADPAEVQDLRNVLAREQIVFAVIARNTRADMARARHILVADEATAQATLAELQAGADFATLAAQRSQDTGSAANGGDLGWTPRGEFVPQFEEAIFSLPLNTPQIVQTDFGFHIVEVLERESQRPFSSFDDLRTRRNASQFYQETFVPWYEELRRQAELSGELQIAAGFDPNTLPIPFPETP